MFLNFLKKIKRKLLNSNLKKKIISNHFQRNYDQKALLSYITEPFINGIKYKHTSHNEAMMIAECLDELKYQVDIIDFDTIDNSIKYNEYKIIIGFGFPLEASFYSIDIKKNITIYYGTGNHYCFTNRQSISRLLEVYRKTGKLMIDSIRFSKYTWSLQTSIASGLILLGNEYTKEHYAKHYFGNHIKIMNIFFYDIFKGKKISLIEEKNIKESRKNFLWFGSNGLVHKGLDILLEYFSKRKDINLYVCGINEYEDLFLRNYDNYLTSNHNNIINCGFIDIHSLEFENILKICSFVIFPSASEGGAASVVNVMGNGGLIPIVSKATCLDVKNMGIVFENLTEAEVADAVELALKKTEGEIKALHYSILKDFSKDYSISSYKINMLNNIKSISENA
ncbi:MAG: glycosyltransferase [Thermonemataceae bacterium]|nr:glycosyltransferase [Thermonemataceae bacterium]